MSIKDDLEDLTRLVKRFTPRYGIDQESLVHDIWLELYVKKLPIYVKHVKHRCIDVIRRKNLARSSESEFGRNVKDQRNKLCDNKIDLDTIFDLAKLEPVEKQVVFEYFYKGRHIEEIAKELPLSISKVSQTKLNAIKKLQRAARFLERKEV